jgi:hypothetical protein
MQHPGDLPLVVHDVLPFVCPGWHVDLIMLCANVSHATYCVKYIFSAADQSKLEHVQSVSKTVALTRRKLPRKRRLFP